MSVTFQFKNVINGARQGFEAEPGAASATFSAESRQKEGLRSDVAIRQFSVPVDEPEVLAGTDKAPNPVEYVLAALASCQEITYRLYADSLGIPLDGVSVRLEGDIDLRGFFGVSPNVRSGFTAIRGEVNLEGPATEAQYAKLKAVVDAHCPVLDIIANPTPVTIALAGASSEVAAA